MTSKFKIEYYHKMPQATSPYLQLLEAKKKIFGYKYELIRNDRPPSHHQKSTHNKSTGHQPSHKHSKTESHEKQKRGTKVGSKKKRSHTEQEERLHDSLFLNRDEKQGKHQATKSLFTAEGAIDHSINPNDFMRNYRQMGDQEERNIKSVTQQLEGSKNRQVSLPVQSHSIQKLEITEIDDLLQLIDGCVEEANVYIGFLSQKIETLKNQGIAMKDQQARILKLKDGIINEKEREIDRLRKELHSHSRPQPEKSFEIKKLLQVLEKMTEENNTLKSKLKEVEGRDPLRKEVSEKKEKDIYNQIHNKIDILNISIDKKQQDGGGGESEPQRDSKKVKNSKNRFYR